jgi:SAM-dependent methyltransferase
VTELREDVEGYYHSVVPFLDHELAERGDEQLWVELARAQRGKRVLELGAGTGRVTALLARGGARVLGIDLSSEMLDRGRARLADAPGVELVQTDMRRLALQERFDLVVAADDPFSHLVEDADRDAALTTIAAHIAPGGRFVLDALWMTEEQLARGRESERRTEIDGRALTIRERWRCDPAAARCDAHYEYDVADEPPRVASFEARAWTLDEIDQRFARAGLRVDARWGDYARTAFDPARSRHLIVRAVLRD